MIDIKATWGTGVIASWGTGVEASWGETDAPVGQGHWPSVSVSITTPLATVSITVPIVTAVGCDLAPVVSIDCPTPRLSGG